jgi:L-rhamnose-proton symport protein (RhaT).
MNIIIGLVIIALGSFCQSSSYVPINKVKSWSWESFWLTQGIFAWLIFPLLGALLAIPEGHHLLEVYANHPTDTLWSMFFGVLWGVGGLTFGLSMRYLGVALGQSIALGTCAGLGTILTPIFTGKTGDLTMPVIVGVVITLIGIGIIGVAGSIKSANMSQVRKSLYLCDVLLIILMFSPLVFNGEPKLLQKGLLYKFINQYFIITLSTYLHDTSLNVVFAFHIDRNRNISIFTLYRARKSLL